MKAMIVGLLVVLLGLAGAGVASAADSTTVPGHSGSKVDADNNGVPDAGVQVVGHYTQVYDDGAGTVCDVLVNYKGDFGNTPQLDSGVIKNHFNCDGPDGRQTFNYMIVSDDDPRYRGNPEWAIWNTWEYKVLTQGGEGATGNLVRPYSHG